MRSLRGITIACARRVELSHELTHRRHRDSNESLSPVWLPSLDKFRTVDWQKAIEDLKFVQVTI